jgi:hypothetical protein
MAATLDKAIEDIRHIQEHARTENDAVRPRWPMIVLRSPKGWTGPKVVDGLQVEGTFRSHQVPILVDAAHPDHVQQLESWMKSYKAEELFDDSGRLRPELAELAPKGNRFAARVRAPIIRRRERATSHGRMPLQMSWTTRWEVAWPSGAEMVTSDRGWTLRSAPVSGRFEPEGQEQSTEAILFRS